MVDILGRRIQTFIGISGMVVTLYIIGGLIKRKPTFFRTYSAQILTHAVLDYGESTNQSGIYGTIAVIFLFQGFYAFSITPMTSLYPTEVSQYKLRATGIAIFRMLDSGFGSVLFDIYPCAMLTITLVYWHPSAWPTQWQTWAGSSISSTRHGTSFS